jgi:hypothetical protein
MKLCRLLKRSVEFRFSETIKQCWLIQSLCIRSSRRNRSFFYRCHLDDICLSEQQTDVTTLLRARERSLHSALVRLPMISPPSSNTSRRTFVPPSRRPAPPWPLSAPSAARRTLRLGPDWPRSRSRRCYVSFQLFLSPDFHDAAANVRRARRGVTPGGEPADRTPPAWRTHANKDFRDTASRGG